MVEILGGVFFGFRMGSVCGVLIVGLVFGLMMVVIVLVWFCWLLIYSRLDLSFCRGIVIVIGFVLFFFGS